MSCSSCSPETNKIGANPANIQWTVVRGDTARIRVEFFENDEVTFKDTSSYTYLSSAYYGKNGTTYVLDTEAGSGYVDIIAPPEITTLWGTGNFSVVGDLNFDLQVESQGVIWTPVIGTICVIGDVTRNSL
jgi:hypothetical protein